MLRNRSFSFLSVVALMLAAAISASAQTEPTTIRVQTADTKAPVAQATVDLYRLDMGGTMSGKTDKSGSITFAGTFAAAEYMIVASAPNFAAGFIDKVRTGTAGIVISLRAGDGSRPTKAQAFEALKNTTAPQQTQSAELTAEQKAQLEKENAAIAAVEAKNAKSKADFDTASKLINEGASAFSAKNFDLAIAKYDEGIAAVPDFPGITPRFLINKGTAHRVRASLLNNQVASSKEMSPTEKAANYAKVQKDLADSVVAYSKSWAMVKDSSTVAATNASLAKTMEGFRDETITASIESFRIAAQIKRVDDALLAPAKAMIPSIVEKQTDAAKRAEALAVFGDVLRMTGDFDGATAEYRKALEIQPENAEALFGAGMSLIMSGYEAKDKVKYQEAANYLGKFESLAKGNAKYAEIAAEVPGLLAELKAADVVPDKAASKPAKKKT